ncbi:MAG TPA: tyrosine-protein phosphatase [Micromonosporaceae bacterium]|nr:tyrosine-protein phosphatase [Micromonosporaceae bacterium]
MQTASGTVGRTLPFTRVFNFRDLGGYPARDGRRVRWRRLFRSDALANLTPAEWDAVAALGLRTVIDLRRRPELSQGPPETPLAQVSHLHFPAGHDQHRADLAWDACDPGEGLARFIADRYLDMVECSRAAFGAALRVIAEPSRAPLVVQCHAGRDRTGVLVALTLALLGVADQDIAQDYARSAAAEERYNAWLRRQDPKAQLPAAHLVATPAEAMLLFLAGLRQRYGRVEQCAAVPGETVAQLRRHLLDAGDPHES